MRFYSSLPFLCFQIGLVLNLACAFYSPANAQDFYNTIDTIEKADQQTAQSMIERLNNSPWSEEFKAKAVEYIAVKKPKPDHWASQMIFKHAQGDPALANKLAAQILEQSFQTPQPQYMHSQARTFFEAMLAKQPMFSQWVLGKGVALTERELTAQEKARIRQYLETDIKAVISDELFSRSGQYPFLQHWLDIGKELGFSEHETNMLLLARIGKSPEHRIQIHHYLDHIPHEELVKKTELFERIALHPQVEYDVRLFERYGSQYKEQELIFRIINSFLPATTKDQILSHFLSIDQPNRRYTLHDRKTLEFIFKYYAQRSQLDPSILKALGQHIQQLETIESLHEIWPSFHPPDLPKLGAKHMLNPESLSEILTSVRYSQGPLHWTLFEIKGLIKQRKPSEAFKTELKSSLKRLIESRPGNQAKALAAELIAESGIHDSAIEAWSHESLKNFIQHTYTDSYKLNSSYQSPLAQREIAAHLDSLIHWSKLGLLSDKESLKYILQDRSLLSHSILYQTRTENNFNRWLKLIGLHPEHPEAQKALADCFSYFAETQKYQGPGIRYKERSTFSMAELQNIFATLRKVSHPGPKLKAAVQKAMAQPEVMRATIELAPELIDRMEIPKDENFQRYVQHLIDEAQFSLADSLNISDHRYQQNKPVSLEEGLSSFIAQINKKPADVIPMPDKLTTEISKASSDSPNQAVTHLPRKERLQRKLEKPRMLSNETRQQLRALLPSKTKTSIPEINPAAQPEVQSNLDSTKTTTTAQKQSWFQCIWNGLRGKKKP